LPRLLVASDYDGTLAPIVEDPERGAAVAGVGRGRCACWPELHENHGGGDLRGGPCGTWPRLSRACRPRCTWSASHGVGVRRGDSCTRWNERGARGLHRRLETVLEDIIDGATGCRGWRVKAGVPSRCTCGGAEPDIAERVLTAVRSGPAGWERRCR